MEAKEIENMKQEMKE